MRSFLLALLLFPVAAFGATGNADNSQKPIDISSDTLVVEQDKQIAIFTGNVVAIQGTMRLRSDKMIVYYTQKSTGTNQPTVTPAATAPQADAPAPGASGAISKIEVEGHVVLATPEESAQGLTGLYQVDQKTLQLTGNVLLTRGKNILRGTRLDYNLQTGHSVLVGQAGSSPNQTGGRVRGVFLPDDKSTNAGPASAPKK